MDGMTMFRVTYDGPALEHHQMDARELAPALMAMADLLESSCKALYGDNAKVQINVKGSFKTGSFNIDFATAVSWLKAARDMFAGDNVTAVANGLQILGALGFIGTKGVTQILKWQRGRKITRVQMKESSAQIFVEEDSIEVEKEAVALLREVPVRQAFDRVLAPLDRSGIDTFAAGSPSEPAHVVIREDERPFFAAPESEDELILQDDRKMVFSIVSLAFKEDNKWRLSDGSATISAIISDERFLADVDQSLESFSKGDVLICMVRMRQWQTRSGAKTEYEVLEVLEHRRAARQISLPGMQLPKEGPTEPTTDDGPPKPRRPRP